MNNQIINVTTRCPIRTTLELVGGKWKLLIMYQLTNKPLRFSELKRQIPDVSEKMLIQELKNLADSRLITRHDFGEIPPKVAYALTATGQKIMPIIAEMRNFAVIYEKEISSSETVFETD